MEVCGHLCVEGNSAMSCRCSSVWSLTTALTLPLNSSLYRSFCSVNSVVILIHVWSEGKYKEDKWVRVNGLVWHVLCLLSHRRRKPCLYLFCVAIFNYSINKTLLFNYSIKKPLLLAWWRNNSDLKLSESVIFSSFIENNKCIVIIRF